MENLQIRKLSPVGVEVLGIDLTQGLDYAAEQSFRNLWHEHHLVLARGQQLSIEQLDRVATIFGQITHLDNYGDYVSNVIPDGLAAKGELELTGSRGHFPLGGEGSTNGQKTSPVLPAGLSAEGR
jgi:hypothetical protein